MKKSIDTKLRELFNEAIKHERPYTARILHDWLEKCIEEISEFLNAHLGLIVITSKKEGEPEDIIV